MCIVRTSRLEREHLSTITQTTEEDKQKLKEENKKKRMSLGTATLNSEGVGDDKWGVPANRLDLHVNAGMTQLLAQIANDFQTAERTVLNHFVPEEMLGLKVSDESKKEDEQARRDGLEEAPRLKMVAGQVVQLDPMTGLPSGQMVDGKVVQVDLKTGKTLSANEIEAKNIVGSPPTDHARIAAMGGAPPSSEVFQQIMEDKEAAKPKNVTEMQAAFPEVRLWRDMDHAGVGMMDAVCEGPGSGLICAVCGVGGCISGVVCRVEDIFLEISQSSHE